MLKAIDNSDWQQSAARLQPVTIAAGQTLFREGDACQNYLLVIDGSVRVQKLSESGREIVLYRVESGETCILTTSCLLSHCDYNAEAITETAVEAIALPQSTFDQALTASDQFRDFVFDAFGSRIAGLVTLIDAVAFGRMDIRLAQLLLEMTPTEGTITTTHQLLARELGTAREVISRLLKEFERHGWVALSRGHVSLLDRSELIKLAAEAAM
ncbi:Crp/Fnr family transcriptional regulator [Solemya pervernicosa gill symbiont]|uniref:Crp/Fnr family transcriptional regulator n=1 Tax=Solemya pervernicosa gill symbiont TaxID=642797 RepID=A0A1T2L197_9GAMM|nr:Crp/Fnr family transcriptional regulator [Solemya pervernicosa gill symbiont]